jgi:Pectate lyase superfamily protein
MIDVTTPPYNADKTGATDSTAAIQSAINEASATGDTVFLPPGQYLAGDLLVEMGIIIEGVGVANLDSKGSRLIVMSGKNGIIVRSGATNATATIIRDLMIVGQPDSLDGIVVRVHGTKLENVLVDSVGGNGIHIKGNEVGEAHNANNWQIENCVVYNCGANGLLVEGGETQAGLCVALDASSNGGWGIVENSFLGNTYVACHTSANAKGSYTVNDPAAGTLPLAEANYSSFFSCYAEADDLPDLSRVTTILVAGGNLAGYTLAGTQATGDLRSVGADQRLGYTWSRQTFREQIPISADGTDTREIHVTIPDLSHFDQIARLMTFTYQPMQSGRQVMVGGAWQPQGQQAIWNLERYVQNQVKEDQYVENSPDRTWLVRTDARNPHQRYDHIVPFGWTDKQHPIGPGYFFFGMPIANQRSHWTWRQPIDQDLPPGTTIIRAADGFPNQWLLDLGNDSVLALFSIEESGLTGLGGGIEMVHYNVLVGPHRINRSAGSFQLKVWNPTNVTVPAGSLTLSAHFQLYVQWTERGY